MSDLENKKTEETPKKRPYNLRILNLTDQIFHTFLLFQICM